MHFQEIGDECNEDIMLMGHGKNYDENRGRRENERPKTDVARNKGTRSREEGSLIFFYWL